MELSKRLQAVAGLVTPDLKIVDIGTDHAYIPIWLVEQGISPSAIAMDINQGPLEKAKENIALHGLTSRIKTRQSDGMRQLKPSEAESVVIAGMGGGLVIKILEDVKEQDLGIKEWILQPQSELKKVREYLNESGYRIVDETMILDEGKFYPMMKAIKGKQEVYREEELSYGKLLLKNRNPILKMFLEKEFELKNGIYETLKKTSGLSAQKRVSELEEEISVIREALATYAL